jgi:hypothetical protein
MRLTGIGMWSWLARGLNGRFWADTFSSFMTFIILTTFYHRFLTDADEELNKKLYQIQFYSIYKQKSKVRPLISNINSLESLSRT